MRRRSRVGAGGAGEVECKESIARPAAGVWGRSFLAAEALSGRRFDARMNREIFPTPMRRCFVTVPLLLAGLFLAAGTARAELTWNNKTVELKADARTTVLEAKFHFTNAGKQAVDVRQIESDCGCTTADLEKRHYEPGESGDIVARYTIGNHVGLQVKTVSVTTSDRAEPIFLKIAVQIPEILRITPAYVAWKHDEEARPKQITLELLQDMPIDSITVQSSNTGVGVAMQTLVKGRKYRLDITPAQTAQMVFATLTIHCHYGKEDKTFRAYATVKAPQAEGQ